jgi:hypothetical protein
MELNGRESSPLRKEAESKGEACSDGTNCEGRTRICGIERGSWDSKVIFRWEGVDSICLIGEVTNLNLRHQPGYQIQNLPLCSEEMNDTPKPTSL